MTRGDRAVLLGGPAATFLCLVGALAAGQGHWRAALLTGALLGATWWLGVQGYLEERSLVSARVVLAGSLAVLVVLPAAIFVADPTLFAGVLLPFTPGLSLWAVGILGIVAGALIGHRWRPARLQELAVRRFSMPTLDQVPRNRWIVVGVGTAAGLVAFLIAAGGPVYYFRNLDRTGLTTSGLTYLIWLILIGKFAVVAASGERWRRGEPLGIALWVGIACALLMVAAVASRLLLVVGLTQVVLLFLATRPPSRRAMTAIAAVAVGSVVLALSFGEVRRWQGYPLNVSFPSYVRDVGIPNLGRTYVNQYADAIRLAVIAREIVPRDAGYERGKELVRVVLQPIPSQVRPKIGTAPALKQAFTSGKGGNSLPIPVVGYIQAGLIGAILFSAALGAFAALIDRLLSVRDRLDVGALLALIAAVTGTVIVLRGSLPNGIALAAIDVLGYLAVHRYLFRTADGDVRGRLRLRRGARVSGG